MPSTARFIAVAGCRRSDATCRVTAAHLHLAARQKVLARPHVDVTCDRRTLRQVKHGSPGSKFWRNMEKLPPPTTDNKAFRQRPPVHTVQLDILALKLRLQHDALPCSGLSVNDVAGLSLAIIPSVHPNG